VTTANTLMATLAIMGHLPAPALAGKTRHQIPMLALGYAVALVETAGVGIARMETHATLASLVEQQDGAGIRTRT